MAEHNDLGKWGEEYAAVYLQKQGYVILDRDWRYGRSKSDIDIICKTPDMRTVVFVEVKTRATEQILAPEDAVNVQKVRHIGSPQLCADVRRCGRVAVRHINDYRPQRQR